MAFVWLLVCLLVQSFDLASSDVQIGNTTSDMRMDGDTIIVVSTDLETCGRACLYQKQCTAINHNSKTSICELLKSEGPLEESLGFNYSDIRTWTMTNDVCHPNPCSDMQNCRKSCHGSGIGFDCITFETPCDQSECQNDATCINRYNSYECRCPEGYGRDRCQLSFCLETPSVYGTNVSDSSLTENATTGTTIDYTCAIGFEDTLGNGGIGYISCLENGTWSTPSNPCSKCSNYSSQFVKIPGKSLFSADIEYDYDFSDDGTAEFCQNDCLTKVDCVATYFDTSFDECYHYAFRVEENFTLYEQYYTDDIYVDKYIRLCEGEVA